MNKAPVIAALTVFGLGLSVMGHIAAQPIQSKFDISSVGSGEKETSFGDLAADALQSVAESDIAFIPSSAFRPSTVSASAMDSSELSSILVVTDSPSDGYVVVKLTGSEIMAALERSVSRLPQTFGGFLQISGLKVVYDPSRPQGSRIVSATLSSGSALSDTSTYTVAMTKPLAGGDMGYFQIWGDNDSAKNIGPSFANCIAQYAVSHQPLQIHTDGRLTSL